MYYRLHKFSMKQIFLVVYTIFAICTLAKGEGSSCVSREDVERLLSNEHEKLRAEFETRLQEEILNLKVDFELKLESSSFPRERRQADGCHKCFGPKGEPGNNGTDGVDGLPMKL